MSRLRTVFVKPNTYVLPYPRVKKELETNQAAYDVIKTVIAARKELPPPLPQLLQDVTKKCSKKPCFWKKC
jgi:hypothetical protein